MPWQRILDFLNPFKELFIPFGFIDGKKKKQSYVRLVVISYEQSGHRFPCLTNFTYVQTVW